MDRPWLLGGDVNVIGSCSERHGGSQRRVGISRKFTWKRGTLMQRLDRCLCNSRWTGVFPHSVWTGNESIIEEIRNFQNKSRDWNYNTFGHIGRRKNILMARVRKIESLVEGSDDNFLLELEDRLNRELNWVMALEESIWHQRARSNWIAKGDLNTSFFRTSTMMRSQHNEISMLQLQDGSWCSEGTSPVTMR
ncbi:uncharacterized protein LOC120176601 [Hibiscus syriacus]|uniref:uncharacterized protein LOC120176601 n=1 Tax=Hibiscus syriacus TaxID=106335 RepID=UPI00192323F0|nr:uncharacterized protein LOC120176601 [Hibiscus syriacus]